jgi:hypothetical protein
MKLFAAGTEPAELERCAADGLCEGVVVLEAGALSASTDGREQLAALGRACAGPVIVEVAADATALAALGPQFAASVPFAAGGAEAIRACRAAGVEVSAGACASADEMVSAARAGARWVSPAGSDYGLLRKTRGLLRALGLRTELLVGPLRDAGVLFDSTIMGAHVALMSPSSLRALAARRAS